jgi:hypothetical protein
MVLGGGGEPLSLQMEKAAFVSVRKDEDVQRTGGLHDWDGCRSNICIYLMLYL